MKKTIGTLLAATLLISSVQAQDKAMSKGKNCLNFYYGWALGSAYVRALTTAASLNLQQSTLGPLGVVYEHMLTDVVGLGAEVGYTQIKLSYQTPSFTSINYTEEWRITTTRLMARLNLHFGNTEKFDAYGLISAGYRLLNFTYSNSDPGFRGYVTYDYPVPIGIKVGIGMRYFFSDNLGIHLEVAAGTPIIGGGLSVKF